MQGMDALQSGQQTIDPSVEREERQRLEKLWNSARPWRFLMDSAWAMGIALVEGQHWINEQRGGPSTSKGRSTFTVYRENSDPSVDNLRVTLNRTRDLTEEVSALCRIDPTGWEGEFTIADNGTHGGHIQVLLDKAIWRDYLATINLPAVAAVQNEWMVTCGTGLLKAIPDKENEFGWDIVHAALDRMVWDPANRSPDIATHNEWADSCAWPAEDVTRAYGIYFDEKKLPSLGSLRAFTNTVGAIRGIDMPWQSESQTPGVLLTEYYSQRWKKLSIFVHTGVGANQAKMVWSGPNPYGACPYLKRDLGTSLLHPWGIGVPFRVKADQKIYNIVMTSIVQHLVTASAVRWIYEENTVRNPSEAFSPRVGGPIAFSPSRTDSPFEPRMVQPPNMNSTAWQLANMMPTLMDDMMHIRPVMLGYSSRRGESGQALAAKVAQAGRFYTQLVEIDDVRTARFLTHHNRVICNQLNRLPRLLQAVGTRLENVLLERARKGTIIGQEVKLGLPPGSIQPRTPQEKQAMTLQLASLKVLDAEEIKYQLFQQTGTPVTSDQDKAIANAAMENEMFLSGISAQQIDAKNYEPHWPHIYTHKQLIQERHSNGIPDAVIREVQWHIADHFDEMKEEDYQRGLDAMASQGNPQAMQQTSESMMGDTPMSGQMAAPLASPADYAAREQANSATASAVA